VLQPSPKAGAKVLAAGGRQGMLSNHTLRRERTDPQENVYAYEQQPNRC